MVYRGDKKIAVHVWPPTILGHTKPLPSCPGDGCGGLRLGLFKRVWDGHLLFHTYTAAAGVEVTPITVRVRIE